MHTFVVAHGVWVVCLFFIRDTENHIDLVSLYKPMKNGWSTLNEVMKLIWIIIIRPLFPYGT